MRSCSGYTTPGGIEIRPADIVIRDGTVVPQDRDFNHCKDSSRYGEIVRDMIAINWDIAKKCKDDTQTVAGVVKTAQLRVFDPGLNLTTLITAGYGEALSRVSSLRAPWNGITVRGVERSR